MFVCQLHRDEYEIHLCDSANAIKIIRRNPFCDRLWMANVAQIAAFCLSRNNWY